MNKSSIRLSDFSPVSDWNGYHDLTSDKVYCNESLSTIRLKCLGVAVGTPVFTTISVVAQIAQIAIKLAVFYHFWGRNDEEGSYDLKGRCVALGLDLLRVASAPISIVAITLSALYGAIFSPKDGRKLCATLERAQAGNFRNTSFYHIGYGATMACVKAIRLATFQRFWEPRQGEYALSERMIAYGKDVGRLLATPFAIVSLIAIDVLRTFSKKFDDSYDHVVDYMYGEFPNFSEKNRRGSYIIAPCFQPVAAYSIQPNTNEVQTQQDNEEAIHFFNNAISTYGDAW